MLEKTIRRISGVIGIDNMGMFGKPRRFIAGLTLLVLGQALSVIHWLPPSYFYFPVVWYGYILTLDGGLEVAGGTSIWNSYRPVFWALIPVSGAFWWLFELFDQAVRSWRYVGGGAFTGLGFVIFASLCFSTVLLAVWETALVVETAAARLSRARDRPRGVEAELDALYRGSTAAIGSGDTAAGTIQPGRARQLLSLEFLLGAVCLVLPLFWPRYAFGLIWASLFLLLDPVNGWRGGTSLLLEVVRRRYATAASFATAALVCGFLWEFWNYWAPIKWVYSVPYVSQLHLFEMPLPGYLGYLPFGLEVFATTVFAVRAVSWVGGEAAVRGWARVSSSSP